MTDKLDIPTVHHSITLPNDIEKISQLSEFVETIAEEAGLDMSLTMSLHLAIEEAVVNVMEYAYPKDTQNEVHIDVDTQDGQIIFTITDSGVAFDPTAQGDVDTTLSAEERPIGGLGIHLVRQIMDDISYQRVNGKNILTLKKNIVSL